MSAPSPRAVLFACTHNRVRSPMAAALLRRLRNGELRVDSCGLEPAEDIDPFVLAVMAEVGIDLSEHRPKPIAGLDHGVFDLVVSLSPQAQARAAELAAKGGIATEYWPTEDPTLETGAREQRIDAYRRVRDALELRLRARFGTFSSGGG